MASPVFVNSFNQFSAATAGAMTWTGFGATIPVGTLVIVAVATNVAASTYSVADNSAQAGAANVYTVVTTSGGASLTLGVAYCFLTRDILTGTTITATFTSSTRKSGQVLCFSGTNAWDRTDVVINKTTSPVNNAIGSTGTADIESLCVSLSGWKGGAVASGWATAISGGVFPAYVTKAGTSSGGVTTRVECNSAYSLNVGRQGEGLDHTFTSITAACGVTVVFTPAVTVADPTVPVVDDFNTGAAQNLTARTGWSATAWAGGLAGSPVTLATDATPTKATGSTALGGNLWTLGQADQEVSVVILPAVAQLHLIGARVQVGGGTFDTFYAAWYGSSSPRLLKVVGGTFTYFYFNLSNIFTPVSGDSIALRVVGTKIFLWYKSGAGSWQRWQSIIDAAISGAGDAGIFHQDATATSFDDWSASGFPVPLPARSELIVVRRVRSGA